MAADELSARHAWDRWEPIWHALFALSLGFPAVRTLLRSSAPAGSRAVTLGVAALLAVSYWVVVVRRPQWHQRTGLMVAFLVWAGVLAGVLVVRDPVFFFLIYGLYPLCFILLPLRLAALGALLLTLAAFAVAQGGLRELAGDPGALLSVVGSTALSITIGVFIQSIARESGQRAEAISELEVARRDLAKAAEEREGLLAETRAALAVAAALSRTSAALVAARSPADVVAAVGEHLGDGIDRVALVDTTTTPPRPLASWTAPASTAARGAAPLGSVAAAPPGTVAAAPPGDGSVALDLPTLAGPGTALQVRAPGVDGTPERWRTIAGQVALALDNLRLVDRARTAGVLEERQRLARELHDTLAQGFTSIVLHLEAAEQALPAQPGEVARHLDVARRTARASLTEARRSVEALRPEPLADAALAPALEGVVRRWSADTGIPASTTVTGEAFGLHPEGEVTLLRSAQEALANVRRHAGASQVQVTLSYLPDLVMLDVRDDGVGMDPAALPRRHVEGGFGLEAMRQRAERAGGRLTVESTPGEGTAVAVALPVGAAEGEGVAS